ncbi:hypothetical protein [Escherichia coli]|uniref:hypothetical protein n=1 Tax=Escherichia coli TaxID=562 RepID=UPI001FCA6007|nr:hypothetical protein [Escherichia coli]
MTALPFTPSNQKPSRLFHAQREKYSHSVLSLRHRSGNAIYPLKRGLFPRHLRAEKARFFVHARILDGSSRHAGWKGKKSLQKNCANLCTIVHLYSEKNIAESILSALWATLTLQEHLEMKKINKEDSKRTFLRGWLRFLRSVERARKKSLRKRKMVVFVFPMKQLLSKTKSLRSLKIYRL